MAEKKNVLKDMGLISKVFYNVPWWKAFNLVGIDSLEQKQDVADIYYGHRRETTKKYSDFSRISRLTFEHYHLTNRGMLAITTGLSGIATAGIIIARSLNLIP